MSDIKINNITNRMVVVVTLLFAGISTVSSNVYGDANW